MSKLSHSVLTGGVSSRPRMYSGTCCSSRPRRRAAWLRRSASAELRASRPPSSSAGRPPSRRPRPVQPARRRSGTRSTTVCDSLRLRRRLQLSRLNPTRLKRTSLWDHKASSYSILEVPRKVEEDGEQDDGGDVQTGGPFGTELRRPPGKARVTSSSVMSSSERIFESHPPRRTA